MLKISRESEINLINVLIDNDVISGKDLINIKKKKPIICLIVLILEKKNIPLKKIIKKN